jgi:hypothetical protein
MQKMENSMVILRYFIWYDVRSYCYSFFKDNLNLLLLNDQNESKTNEILIINQKLYNAKYMYNE